MSERIIDRFDKYMAVRGLNDNKVTIQLEFSVGMLGKSRKSGRDLSKKAIEKILNFYTDIEKVWLLTGEGEMIKERSSYIESDKAQDTNLVKEEIQDCCCRECLIKDQRIAELEKQLKEKDLRIDNLNEIIRQQIKEWGAASGAWRVPDDKKDTG